MQSAAMVPTSQSQATLVGFGATSLPMVRQASLYPSEAEWDAILRSAAKLWTSGIATEMGFKTEAAIVTVAMKGWELGVPLMSSLEGISIIKGKPKPSGKFLSFLGARVGARIEWVQDGRRGIAECIAHRPGRNPIRGIFTWNDAKRAGLVSKDNYQNYPADMLCARAESRAAWKQYSDLYYGYVPPTGSDVLDVDPTVDPNPEPPTTAPTFDDGDGAFSDEGEPIPPEDASSAVTDDMAAAVANSAPSAPPKETKRRRATAAATAAPAATATVPAPTTATVPEENPKPADAPVTQAQSAPVPQEQPVSQPVAADPPKIASAPAGSEMPPDEVLPFTRGDMHGKKLSELVEANFKAMIPGYRTAIAAKTPDDPARKVQEAWLGKLEAWAKYRGVVV